MPFSANNKIRFGGFEFDQDAEQLFQSGEKVDLQPKPAAILGLMLKRRDRLVTRQEIAAVIWPNRTVDFDQRISTSVKQIRKALRDDSARPAFIETVPRKGYRFIAPIEPEISAPTETGGLNKNSSGWGSWKFAGAIGIIVIFALVAAASNIAGNLRNSERGEVSSNEISAQLLMVLPGAADNEDNALLAAALTDEISARLTRIRPQSLGIIARMTASQFQAEPSSLARARSELNVGFVLQTRINGIADERAAAFELIRLRDQTQLWREEYALGSDEWEAIRNDVGAQVVRVLNLRLTHAIREDQAQSLTSSAAFNAYLTGQAFLNRFGSQGREKAITHFERAIAEDPEFAPAYVSLAKLLIDETDTLPLARNYLDKALSLDPELASAHETFGEINLWRHKDLAAAQRAFERAITLQPGRTSSRLGYANFLSAAGRTNDAVEQAAIARALDPLSASTFGQMGWFYLYANKPELAIPECERALALNRGNAYYALIANDCLIHAHNQLQEFDKTIAPMLDVMQLYGDGDTRETEISLASTIEEKAKIYWSWRIDAMSKFGAHIDIAKAYMELNDQENALARLEAASAENAAGLVHINTDPAWAALRGNPRFEKIAREVFSESRI